MLALRKIFKPYVQDVKWLSGQLWLPCTKSNFIVQDRLSFVTENTGPVVQWLRYQPYTLGIGVRFSAGPLRKNTTTDKQFECTKLRAELSRIFPDLASPNRENQDISVPTYVNTKKENATKRLTTLFPCRKFRASKIGFP